MAGRAPKRSAVLSGPAWSVGEADPAGVIGDAAFASHRPVQLRLRNGELPPVTLGPGPAGVVPSRVAEDPAREHDEALRRRLEVHIPAGLVIEDIGECLREFSRFGFVGFEVRGGPDVWLVGRGAPGPVPADLADGQLQVLQACSGAEALRYEGALDHEISSQRWHAAWAPMREWHRQQSRATVAAATDKPRPRTPGTLARPLACATPAIGS